MKTSILFKFILLGLVLSSCSDNNEPVSSETGTDNEEVTSIVLSTASNEVNTNSLVSFVVTSNTSTDLTSLSSLKLDGVAVSNPLLFNFEGVYEVVATFEDLTSNTVTITVTNVNIAPVAVDDAISTAENTVFNSITSLISNDTDIDGDTLNAVAGTFSTAQGGSFLLYSAMLILRLG